MLPEFKQALTKTQQLCLYINNIKGKIDIILLNLILSASLIARLFRIELDLTSDAHSTNSLIIYKLWTKFSYTLLSLL